jgi:hypothetical protein
MRKNNSGYNNHHHHHHHQSNNKNQTVMMYGNNRGRYGRAHSSSSSQPYYQHRRRYRPSTSITKTHAQYVLANYFFHLRPVLSSNIELYQSLKETPDPEIDDESIWSLVECVTIPISVPDVNNKTSVEYIQRFPRCPICLEQPPLCPRVTTCGHVFCYTCLMRYLSYAEEHHLQKDSGKVVKKCPVCSELISLDTCKSVEWRVNREIRAGQILNFDLIKRMKGSVIPVKAIHSDDNGSTETELFPIHGSPDAELCKFNIASDVQIRNLLNREQNELQHSLSTSATAGIAHDKEELSFLRAALREIEKRKTAWDSFLSDHANLNILKQQINGHPVRESPLKVATNKEFLSQSKSPSFTISAELEAFGDQDEEEEGKKEISQEIDDNYDDDGVDELSDDSPGTPEYDEDGNIISEQKKKQKMNEVYVMTRSQYQKGKNQELDSYYYYQLSDNQMVFLHPLNIRCLIHEHQGDFTKFPSRIRAKVIEVEPTELIDSLRKKIGVLSHIPLYCQFYFVEVDLLYNRYISPATREYFAVDFQNREKKRRDSQRRKAREDRRAREFEEQERQKRLAQIEERKFTFNLDLFPEIEPSESVLKSTEHFPSPRSTLVPATDRSSPKNNMKKKPTTNTTWGVKNIMSSSSIGSSSASFPPLELQGQWKQKLSINPGKAPKRGNRSQPNNSPQYRAASDFPALPTRGQAKKK